MTNNIILIISSFIIMCCQNTPFFILQVNNRSNILLRRTACQCLWELEMSYPVRQLNFFWLQSLLNVLLHDSVHVHGSLLHVVYCMYVFGDIHKPLESWKHHGWEPTSYCYICCINIITGGLSKISFFK